MNGGSGAPGKRTDLRGPTAAAVRPPRRWVGSRAPHYRGSLPSSSGLTARLTSLWNPPTPPLDRRSRFTLSENVATFTDFSFGAWITQSKCPSLLPQIQNSLLIWPKTTFNLGKKSPCMPLFLPNKQKELSPDRVWLFVVMSANGRVICSLVSLPLRRPDLCVSLAPWSSDPNFY